MARLVPSAQECPGGYTRLLHNHLLDTHSVPIHMRVQNTCTRSHMGRTAHPGKTQAKAELLSLLGTRHRRWSPAVSPRTLTCKCLQPGHREMGRKMNRCKDFFITFLNILLIASSVADVVCLMMHRQEAAPNP